MTLQRGVILKTLQLGQGAGALLPLQACAGTGRWAAPCKPGGKYSQRAFFFFFNLIYKFGKDEAEFRKIISKNIFCFARSSKTVEANQFVCGIQLLDISFPSSSGKRSASWQSGCCDTALHFGFFYVCGVIPSIFSVTAVISGTS